MKNFAYGPKASLEQQPKAQLLEGWVEMFHKLKSFPGKSLPVSSTSLGREGLVVVLVLGVNETTGPRFVANRNRIWVISTAPTMLISSFLRGIAEYHYAVNDEEPKFCIARGQFDLICTTLHAAGEAGYKHFHTGAKAVILDEAGATNKADAVTVIGNTLRLVAMAGDEK
ncbi:hypothetical protein NW762_000079 [Fusarium torreyae]|uniref:Uncharacterized protein n=1 Tax=Fusarium torreyae TaxID=1237075 RepID=A0A9W8SFN1_9HYPO|nr:hypothetical protein NW762_000079 [Fusarium torreyae]